VPRPPLFKADILPVALRPLPSGGDHLWRGVYTSGLRSTRGKLHGENAVATSDIEDAKAGRRTNKFKDEVLLKSIGNLTERAFAPSRVSGGQPLKILVAVRVLRRHQPDSRPVEASAFFSAATTASRACLVVHRRRLNRIAPMPTSRATPMASSTGESSIRPE
jgi:hypothetical protein